MTESMDHGKTNFTKHFSRHGDGLSHAKRFRTFCSVNWHISQKEGGEPFDA
jgi:hypothetical protein